MEKQVIKQDYVAPLIEIVEFQLEDSIAVSSDTKGAAFYDDLWGTGE